MNAQQLHRLGLPAALSNCAARVKRSFRRKVSGSRLIMASEVAKRNLLSVDNDVSPVASTSFVAANAESSCATADRGSTKILEVHASGDITKVGNAVVNPVAIDMVDVLRRMRAVDVQPSQSVRKVLPTINRDVVVPVFPKSAAMGAGFKPRASNSADEDAGLGVVGKKLAQSVYANIIGSHEALLLPIGQGPAAMGSRALASPIFGEEANCVQQQLSGVRLPALLPSESKGKRGVPDVQAVSARAVFPHALRRAALERLVARRELRAFQPAPQALAAAAIQRAQQVGRSMTDTRPAPLGD